MAVQRRSEPISAGRYAGAPALHGCLSTIATWIVRSRERRALRELAQDRWRLSDMGLTRQQVLREATKPFWRR
jgi:uncharacterized protein YjiS (DUF1127 family)